MPGIFILAIALLVVLAVAGFAAHLLFSPWILLAVAIVAVIKLRPRGRRS
jgi:hypothetical protein